MMASMEKAKAAKTTVKRLLAGVEGVSGVGITRNDHGEPSVLVNVQKDATARVKARLSKRRVEVPVIVEEVGVITFES